MRRLPAPVIAGVLLSALLPAVTLGATTTMSVYVGEDCVYFHGTANKVHTLWLLDGSDVLSSGKATSDADGDGHVCFDSTVASGHSVKIQPAGLAARTITVPNVSAKADRVGDVVSGDAPAGQTVYLSVDTYKTGTYTFNKTIEKTLTAGSGGAWSSDLTAAGGIRGGDEVWAAIQTAAGDEIWAYLVVEQMGVYRGGAYGFGHVNRGEVVTLTLRTSTNAIRATALLTQIYADGYAKAALWSSTGRLVYAHAGDKLAGSFAGDASLTVPAMTVKGVASTDVVTVACPGMAGQGVYLSVSPADGSASVERTGVISSAGTKVWDLTATLDLRAGDHLDATCKTDPGDEIGRAGVAGS